MKRLAVLLFLALPFAANAQMSNDDVHKYDHTNQLFYRNEIVIPGFDGYMTLSATSISTHAFQMVLSGRMCALMRHGRRVWMQLR